MERVQLSMKESKRISALEELKHGKITQIEAASKLNIGVRQVQRLIKRYLVGGVKGLVHKLRGKPSPKKQSDAFKKKIVDIVLEHYFDFGPTLIAEMLQDRHNIGVHKETLRRLMINAGIWKKKKKRAKHRSWRAPKDRRGELVQLDVSYHNWFEDRAGWGYLVKFIDDATKEVLYAKFITGESYKEVTQATIEYFQLHGLPQELYTDKGKVFKVNIGNENNDRLTQYEYALHLLGVELSHANSPQAKGRVERSFQTDQDRLVKMLRIERISTIAIANEYLHTKYIPKINQKFTRPAALKGDLHLPLNGVNLYDIFCIREKRSVQHDWTIRYKNRILQITGNQKIIVRPKDVVMVLERLDGSIYLQLRSVSLNFIEIAVLPEKIVEFEPKPLVAIKYGKNSSWRKTNSIFYKSKPETRHSYGGKQHDISIVS